LGRVLLLLIIVFLLWVMFRGFFRSRTKKADPPAKAQAGGEDMVACARCGVNMPRSEARLESGIFYCHDNPRCRAP
jgi:uncharacterized protein